MPVKIRRTSSRQASSTNLAPKMALTTITTHNQPQQVDKDGEKHLKKRTNSSQGLAQHQPRPFSRTGSQSKLCNKPTTKHVEQQVETPPELQHGDDDDWVSSSSAVPSPAPEPDDEEEDAVIYVNPNLNSRHAHHESPPATPKRTNHPLPHHHNQRHQLASHATDHSAAPPARYPHNGVPERQQTVVPIESSRIRFAGEPPTLQVHPQDSRIHHNGAAHHVSPPPTNLNGATANASDLFQLSSSVIRVSDPVAPDKPVNGTHYATQRTDRSQNMDERGDRRVSAKFQPEQVDEYSARQIATTQSIRPAVSRNGDGTDHAAQEDIGRTSQRGFGAPPTQVHQPFNDAPPPQVAPSAHKPTPVSRHRPSMLRRDTTPTAMSRSPVAIDAPPRSFTPPASMTNDEMVANNNNKRHSIHSTGGHRRPMSLLQPSQTKLHSLSSRPGTHYDYRHAHNPNNPLSLLVRLNPMQCSPLTAPPTISPGVAHGEIDNEAGYLSMSPTVSHSGGRSLRKRASTASLNSIATAPVVSTSSTMAMGSSASPTSALKTTSSAILSSLAHQPAKQTSMTPRSDPRQDLRRGDSLRADDSPNFVSQFCSSLKPEANRIGSRKVKALGHVMAGGEWTSHRTAMDHRGLLFESFSRLANARPGCARAKH